MSGQLRVGRSVRAPSAEEVLEQRANFLVGTIANRLVNCASALYRREFGIGFTEWRVMVMLALEPHTTAKRIVDVSGVDKAAISRGIKTLEAAGMIQSTERTARLRSRSYLLTEAGQAAHDQILLLSREQERRLLSGLAPQEIPVLLDMLRRLLAQIPLVEALVVERG